MKQSGKFLLSDELLESLKFKIPKIKYFVLDKEKEYEPDVKTLQQDSTSVIMKKTDLCFISLKKGNYIVDVVIGYEGHGRKSKRIPWKHILEVDKANNQMRLVGKSTKPKWIDIPNYSANRITTYINPKNHKKIT